jgi:hypothetical protein
MHLQQDLRHVRGIYQFSEHLQRATDFHALYQLREYGAVPALPALAKHEARRSVMARSRGLTHIPLLPA